MKNERNRIIVRTSVISIVANILLSLLKAVIGFLSNSIAIISDAINNISDALSSIITIVGTKLASKAPDKKHPYRYGRIEYMTSFIVSAIVLYAGITAFIESVKKIINPGETTYNYITVIILVLSILTKFILGIYVKNKGSKINSPSLVASGADAFNDGVLSSSVLLSVLVHMVLKINIEAYIGIILSCFILKAGYDLIRESVDNIIGSRVDNDLAIKIKKEVMKDPDVAGAFDLILTNYGPDKYLGSIHVEIKDTLTASAIDKISRRVSKNVSNKYGVLLHTIGVYSMNTKDKDIVSIKKDIHDIVFSNKDILQMHGFYLDKEDKTISFDIIIDFNSKNREGIYQKIYDEVSKKYSEYKIIITLDVDTSD